MDKSENVTIVKHEDKMEASQYQRIKLFALTERNELIEGLSIVAMEENSKPMIDKYREVLSASLKAKGYENIIIKDIGGEEMKVETLTYEEAVTKLQEVTGKENIKDFAILLQDLIEIEIKEKHNVLALELLAQLVLSEIEK